MSLRYKIKNGADIVKHFGSTGNVMEKQRITDERIGRVYKSHHENWQNGLFAIVHWHSNPRYDKYICFTFKEGWLRIGRGFREGSEGFTYPNPKATPSQP